MTPPYWLCPPYQKKGPPSPMLPFQLALTSSRYPPAYIIRAMQSIAEAVRWAPVTVPRPQDAGYLQLTTVPSGAISLTLSVIPWFQGTSQKANPARASKILLQEQT